MKRFGIAILLSALCGCTAVNTARLNPAVVPASKPATAGIAAGSHATKALSTGPAEVGVGRKAFPPREHQPPKRVAIGPMQPNTMGGGGVAHAVDYPPCGATAGLSESSLCDLVPATPFSGFGVLTKGPLVTANGVGAARLITTGEYIICNGTLSCAADLDGSYELCLGDDACKDVVHESCVVDVGPPSPLYGHTMTVLDLGFEIHILRKQNEHCKDGKDRVNLYLDWLIASSKLEPSLPLTTGIGNPVVGDAAGQLTTGTDGWHPVPAPVKGKP